MANPKIPRRRWKCGLCETDAHGPDLHNIAYKESLEVREASEAREEIQELGSSYPYAYRKRTANAYAYWLEHPQASVGEISELFDLSIYDAYPIKIKVKRELASREPEPHRWPPVQAICLNCYREPPIVGSYCKKCKKASYACVNCRSKRAALDSPYCKKCIAHISESRPPITRAHWWQQIEPDWKSAEIVSIEKFDKYEDAWINKSLGEIAVAQTHEELDNILASWDDLPKYRETYVSLPDEIVEVAHQRRKQLGPPPQELWPDSSEYSPGDPRREWEMYRRNVEPEPGDFPLDETGEPYCAVCEENGDGRTKSFYSCWQCGEVNCRVCADGPNFDGRCGECDEDAISRRARKLRQIPEIVAEREHVKLVVDDILSGNQGEEAIKELFERAKKDMSIFAALIYPDRAFPVGCTDPYLGYRVLCWLNRLVTPSRGPVPDDVIWHVIECDGCKKEISDLRS